MGLCTSSPRLSHHPSVKKVADIEAFLIGLGVLFFGGFVWRYNFLTACKLRIPCGKTMSPKTLLIALCQNHTYMALSFDRSLRLNV